MIDGDERSVANVSWLGIGAQRCGTTWFVDLLCQHPRVGLSPAQFADPLHQKELHLLDRFGGSPEAISRRYFELFPRIGDGVHRGEFTPSYLRSPGASTLVETLLPANCTIFVLLRDPVERFRSAIDLRLKQQQVEVDKLPREHVYDAIWGGLYETHLQWWRSLADRMMFIRYEELCVSPEATLEAAWARLGLDPVQLTNVGRRSITDVERQFDFDEVPALREHLEVTYRRERVLLARDLRDLWDTVDRQRGADARW